MTTTARYNTKQAIIKALDSQDEKALINILDEYKGSYSVKMVLEILLDRQAIKDASQKEPVVLSFDDRQKIKTIKIVRLFTGWGLKESKEYVESDLPIELPQDGSIISLEDAFIAALRSAGAIVRDRKGNY